MFSYVKNWLNIYARNIMDPGCEKYIFSFSSYEKEACFFKKSEDC